MSKAQKQAQNKFKEAVKIAKQLRVKDPKLSHPEAVKKAFAQLSGTKKPAIKKAAKKNAKPAIKKAARPVAKKKASCSTDHRDNKSHNVNIRVMSGVVKTTVQDILNIYTFEQAREIRNKTENKIKELKNNILKSDEDVRKASPKSTYKKLSLQYNKFLKHELKSEKQKLKKFNEALEKY